MAAGTSSSCEVLLDLTEDDIEGACLDEPLHSHTVEVVASLPWL